MISIQIKYARNHCFFVTEENNLERQCSNIMVREWLKKNCKWIKSYIKIENLLKF